MPRRVKIAEVDHEYKNAPSKESLRYCKDQKLVTVDKYRRNFKD